MKILFQLLSSFVVIVGIFQKQKWKMMLWYTISNILTAIMYLAFYRIDSMAICFVAAIRTLIYMIYSIKKAKPNLMWLIIFESAFVITAILTWQDTLSLLPLLATLSVGYGSWQDNQTILRISYIINGLLYVIYQSIVGVYISLLLQSIILICTIVCFIYYCILKKEKPILDIFFRTKSKKIITEDVSNIEKTNNIDD